MTNAGRIGIGAVSIPGGQAQLWVANDVTLIAGNYAGDVNAQIMAVGATNTNKRLALMYDTTLNIGLVQAMIYGTGTSPLCLNAAGGNVGIGKTNPATALDVTGTVTATTMTASSIGFNAVPAVATRSTQRFYVYDPSFCIELMQRSSSIFGLNFITRNTDGVFSWRKVANGGVDWGTELMFLDNSGNLTTTAGVTATTLTGAGSGITALNMGNAGSGTLAVARGGTGTTTSTGTGSVVLSNAPTLTGTTNMATLVASGNITSSSDRRIKKDIKRIEGALDKVTQIGGYTFTRTDDPHEDQRQAGIIAQEIIEVLPEVVQKSEETGYYSVSYGNITALLIEALKEERLERLKLEERLARLENYSMTTQ